METFTDDTVVALASFLSPHDMLSLALTCKRFGSKHGTTTSRSRRMAAREERSMRNVSHKTESISLMEAAARTVLQTKWTEEEKNALPRREDESWTSLYNEFLSVFRLPLQFDKLAGDCIGYVDGSNKITVCTNRLRGEENSGTAICSNVMRAGIHHISFQVYANDPLQHPNYGGIICGIMRPTTNDITSLETCHPADNLSRFSLKDYENLHNDNVDVCLLSTNMGNGILRSRWKRWETPDEECLAFDWEGMESTHDKPYRIGMVLDLDEGTLDVYKNDRRLGTMMSGLDGEYNWAVQLIWDAPVSVSIGR